MGARGGKPLLPPLGPPSRGVPATVEAAAAQTRPSPDHEVRLPPRQRRPRAGACGGARWQADRAARRTRRGGRHDGLGTCRALAQTRKTTATTTRSLRLAVVVMTATALAMALTEAVTAMVGVGTRMVGTGLTGRARPNRLGLGFSGRYRYRSDAVEFAWAVGVWRGVNVGRVRRSLHHHGRVYLYR